MKKKVLLSSILTIVLCFSLIAGSTFALFTSQTKVNVVVSAGKVEMAAGIAITKLESVKGDTAGTIVDENGSTYSYADRTSEGTFTNGGTATIDGAVLTLDKITPGDKVTFAVSGVNTSDVAVQYRYTVECLSGYKLMSGLVVTVNDDAPIESLASYTSPWMPLAVGANIDTVTVSIELPVTAGNEYQAQTTELKVVVEAVQGNAVVEDNTAPIIETVAAATDAASFEEALASSAEVIGVADDMALTVGDIANKTIKADGNDVALTFTGKMENVVVDGIESTTAGNKINVKNATGDLTVTNSTLVGAAGTSNMAIALGPNANITIDNCDISTESGKTYGIYTSGASGAVTITNTTFTNIGSWAIQIKNAINGDLVVSGCTFNTPDGVLKVLSGVNGDATFTNNTMIGCKGHDAAGPDALVVSTSSKWKPLSCTGTKTVYGNTLDGAEWTQQ